MQDKQDELDGLVRSHSQEKFVLNEEIAKLKEEISQLKSDLQSKEEEMESEREFYNEEINLRQGDLLNLEKVLESYKKQNADHRKEICGLKEEIERISLEG